MMTKGKVRLYSCERRRDAHLTSNGLKPADMSATHGQCNASLPDTFPVTEQHRPLATKITLFCDIDAFVDNFPRLITIQ